MMEKAGVLLLGTKPASPSRAVSSRYLGKEARSLSLKGEALYTIFFCNVALFYLRPSSGKKEAFLQHRGEAML